jgi:hypothetical protein
MEHCPTEVLHEIFALACTDGGYTARSLSLVSRIIYQKSRYSRFHSVACHGAAQTLRFAAILQKTPPHFRVVRHLFLACSYKDEVNTTHGYSSIPIIPSPTCFGQGGQPASILCGTNSRRLIPFIDTMRSIINLILTTVAPTLYTLSMYTDWPSWNILALPPFLPVLIELSINHKFSGGFLRDKSFDSLISCPSLRRLVLMGFLRAINPLKLANKIKAFAPSLSRLCIPFTSIDNPQSLLFDYNGGVTTTYPDNGSELAEYLRTLEYLAIRGPGKCFFSSSMEDLERRNHKVVAIERVWERGGTEQALRGWEIAWLDGISGGEGYWDLSGRVLATCRISLRSLIRFLQDIPRIDPSFNLSLLRRPGTKCSRVNEIRRLGFIVRAI